MKKQLETLVENLGSVVNATEKALETTEKNLSKINELNDKILDKVHSIFKIMNKESEMSIRKMINSPKPPHASHLTDEEWEAHKLRGQRLLNLYGGSISSNG